MPAWISRLLSSDDRAVDSVIVAGLVSLVVMFALTGWDVVKNHHDFSPFVFASGASVILAGIGGGKMLRDGRIIPSGTDPQPPS
jgi:hypothetical protein